MLSRMESLLLKTEKGFVPLGSNYSDGFCKLDEMRSNFVMPVKMENTDGLWPRSSSSTNLSPQNTEFTYVKCHMYKNIHCSFFFFFVKAED